jgi:hypothetical protein
VYILSFWWRVDNVVVITTGRKKNRHVCQFLPCCPLGMYISRVVNRIA